MKVLLVLAAVIAFVVTEDCQPGHGHGHGCTDTQCHGNATVGCSTPQHICTCYDVNDHQIACSTKADCEKSSLDDQLKCSNAERHCIDQFCHCENEHGPQNHGPGNDHLHGHPPN